MDDDDENWVLLGHPCKQGVLAIGIATEDGTVAGKGAPLSWKRTFCVCLDAAMMMYEHEHSADDTQAEPLALIFWLELHNVTLQEEAGFNLHLQDGRVVHLQAESLDARREWIQRLLSLAATRATHTLHLSSGSEWEDVQVGV